MNNLFAPRLSLLLSRTVSHSWCPFLSRSFRLEQNPSQLCSVQSSKERGNEMIYLFTFSYQSSSTSCFPCLATIPFHSCFPIDLLDLCHFGFACMLNQKSIIRQVPLVSFHTLLCSQSASQPLAVSATDRPTWLAGWLSIYRYCYYLNEQPLSFSSSLSPTKTTKTSNKQQEIAVALNR